MYQFHNIVVADDGHSLPSAEAVRIADEFGSDVRVCTAASDADVVEHVLVECDEWSGEGWTANVVVLGTRRASRAERVLIGPTGMRLVRQCPVPVWSVRPGRVGVETTVAVAVDTASEGAQTLVDLGVEIAAKWNAGLLLIHAIAADELTEQSEQQAGSALQQLLSSTDHGSVAGGVRPYLAAGRPDRVVLAALDEFDVDLVMMGTGLHPIAGLGDVCESVLPQLHCSVLTVPQGWEP